MSVEYFTGDILQSTERIILHQVNCKGVMGAGIALQIKNKYPEVYADYKEYCDKHNYLLFPKSPLGTILDVDCWDGRTIINLFAQDRYGVNNCQTNYDALKKCLIEVNNRCYGMTIAIPYKMSCGLSGGDWGIVSKMIEDTLKDCTVHIYKLDENS